MSARIVFVILLLAVMAGGGAYYYFEYQKKNDKKDENDEPEPEPEPKPEPEPNSPPPNSYEEFEMINSGEIEDFCGGSGWRTNHTKDLKRPDLCLKKLWLESGCKETTPMYKSFVTYVDNPKLFWNIQTLSVGLHDMHKYYTNAKKGVRNYPQICGVSPDK